MTAPLSFRKFAWAVLLGTILLVVAFRHELRSWLQNAPDHATPHAHTGAPGTTAGEIAHYTCPMHPSVKQPGPGQCPLCGMELTPVETEAVENGMIVLDEGRRQRIGVRTAPVARIPMKLRIRAVGVVKYDETRLTDVNLRTSGWVQRLVADETGQRVRQGQTLLTLYSPELYAAQGEHLMAVRRQGSGAGDMFAHLAEASRQRLRLLGMSAAQIRALEARGEAQEEVAIVAPAAGFVIEKNVVTGARVEAGALVYRTADMDKIWVDAEIYESDLVHIRKGQSASVTLPFAGGDSVLGKVDHIYPTLQGGTRTARVRIVLDNRALAFKPDMYADVEVAVDLGERLAIPESAVIYTGPRRLVFIEQGEGRFQPREVTLGVHVENHYEVTKGLEAGERVVVSGNFLIAAESRIRAATGDLGAGHDAH